MKMIWIITVSMLALGCATFTQSTVERKQAQVMVCMKELRADDAGTLDAFEVCRQIYGLKRTRDEK